jgi:hypothetical protein
MSLIVEQAKPIADIHKILFTSDTYLGFIILHQGCNDLLDGNAIFKNRNFGILIGNNLHLPTGLKTTKQANFSLVPLAIVKTYAIVTLNIRDVWCTNIPEELYHYST